MRRRAIVTIGYAVHTVPSAVSRPFRMSRCTSLTEMLCDKLPNGIRVMEVPNFVMHVLCHPVQGYIFVH
jgi:hypothetical protein